MAQKVALRVVQSILHQDASDGDLTTDLMRRRSQTSPEML